MKATDLLSYFKKIIKGLIILNITLVLAIVIIVYIFLHYLSLYDFTNDNNQYVKDITTMDHSNINLNNK